MVKMATSHIMVYIINQMETEVRQRRCPYAIEFSEK